MRHLRASAPLQFLEAPHKCGRRRIRPRLAGSGTAALGGQNVEAGIRSCIASWQLSTQGDDRCWRKALDLIHWNTVRLPRPSAAGDKMVAAYKQREKRLGELKPLSVAARPARGWIRAIREALGRTMG